MAQVFVSHAGVDAVAAEEVCGWLKAAGHDVFLDQDLDNGLVVGEEWEEQSSRPVDEDLLGGFRLRGFVGSFDEFAVDERGPGADEGDQVWAVDRAPAVLRGLDQLERHGQPGRA